MVQSIGRNCARERSRTSSGCRLQRHRGRGEGIGRTADDTGCSPSPGPEPRRGRRGGSESRPHQGPGRRVALEKIVATASKQVVILADDTKLVARLGTKAPLPVEVVPFGWKTHLAFVESLGGAPSLRTEPDGRPFVTDEGNYILHCRFEGGIPDPATWKPACSAGPASSGPVSSSALRIR